MQTVSRPRLSGKVAAKPSEGASVSKNGKMILTSVCTFPKLFQIFLTRGIHCKISGYKKRNEPGFVPDSFLLLHFYFFACLNDDVRHRYAMAIQFFMVSFPVAGRICSHFLSPAKLLSCICYYLCSKISTLLLFARPSSVRFVSAGSSSPLYMPTS